MCWHRRGATRGGLTPSKPSGPPCSQSLAGPGTVGSLSDQQVGLPVTTVRAWLRRARANSEAVRVDATVAVHALDPPAGPLNPTGSALGDMLDAVGRALTAAILRLGLVAAPWQYAVVLTRAAILAPTPQPVWHRSG